MQWIQFFIELIFQIIWTWVCSEQISFCIKIDVWVQICNKGSFRMYLRHIPCARLNPLWPSDAIWRQRSGSTLADGTKSLPKPMLTDFYTKLYRTYAIPNTRIEFERNNTPFELKKTHIKLQWNWHEIPLLDYANNLQIFYPFRVELCAVFLKILWYKSM